MKTSTAIWLATSAVLGVAACSASDSSGCTKDTDCATGRICGSNGRCEDATSGSDSGSSGDSGGASSDGGATSGEASGPLDISGEWRLCDTQAQAGNPYYIPAGGEVVSAAVAHGVASAYLLSADGGVASAPVLSGPLDQASRVWTADFFTFDSVTGKVDNTYPSSVRVTFSSDGTRFTAVVTLPDESGGGGWFGGREDGVFTCSK